MVHGSRESVAYAINQIDTSRFEAGQPAPAAGRSTAQPKGREQKGGAGGARKKRRKIRLVTPARLLCAIFVVVLCVGMVYSQMRLTQLTNDITKCENTIEDLASAHVALTSKFEEKYNAEFIADYAENTLGMVKMNAGQEEYLEMTNPDEIDVSRDTANLSGAVGGLVRGFTAILEYLR